MLFTVIIKYLSDQVMMDKISLGIDFGTEYISSTISINNQDVERIPFDNGYKFRACLFFREENVQIGKTAYSRWKNGKKNTIILNNLQLLGNRYEEVNDGLEFGVIIDEENNYPIYKIERKDIGDIIYPEEVCAALLETVKSQIEYTQFALKSQKLNQYEITATVITVPLYFNSQQRRAVLDSANLVGLNNVNLLNESTAAAVGFHSTSSFTNIKTKINLLIYHFGATSFDLSLIETTASDITVKHTISNCTIGGTFIDELIVKSLLKSQNQNRPTKQYLRQLKAAVIEAKEQLAHNDTASVELMNDFLEISIAKFNEITSVIIEKTLKIVQTACKEWNINKDDIEVLLIGGSTKIRSIQTAMSKEFKKIHTTAKTEHMAALGACIMGHNQKKFTLNEITSSTIDIKQQNCFTTIIQKGKPLPVTSSQKRNKENVLQIYINTNDTRRLLDKFYLDTKDDLPINISIDSNDILRVSIIQEKNIMGRQNDKSIEKYKKMQQNFSIFKGNLNNEERIKKAKNKLEVLIYKSNEVINKSNIPVKYKTMFKNICYDVSNEYGNSCKSYDLIMFKMYGIENFMEYLKKYRHM